MKVIHQLITYFHERGTFTDAHLEEFVKKGFWGFYKSTKLEKPAEFNEKLRAVLKEFAPK
jgi:hypothetical protein